MSNENNAKVVRVSNNVAYVYDDDRGQLSGFSFGKINGYKGESAKEINLVVGREVTVIYSHEGKVESVFL